MIPASAFERMVHFLSEKWIEPYKQHCSAISQVKKVLGGKNNAQNLALHVLENCDA